MSNLNIFVTYGDHTKLFSCSTRREFGSRVGKFFGLDKSEMELYAINGKSRDPVTINEIKDKMKLELRKNGIKPTSKTNGKKKQGSDELPSVETGGLEVENVKVPDQAELKRKLIDNRVLSGSERRFLLQLLEDFSDSTPSTSRKRKRVLEEEGPSAVEKANKKVQVDLVLERKNTYTQTDPMLLNVQAEPSSSKDLISESKRLARFEKKDAQKVRKLMDETFEARRQFILLKNPVLHMVKEKYPLLFSTQEVVNELNRIFYDKKDEEFLSNIKRHSTSILSVLDDDNALLKTIKEAKDKAITVAQKSYVQQVGAILAISNVMREKRTYLYTEDEPCEKNNYPRIEAQCEVSKLFEDVNTYRIIVEGIVLCEASTFPEALLCLLACYFIFNISYPEQSFDTFVAMEKLFLDANDTDVNDIDDETAQIIRLVKLKTNPNS